MKIKVTPFVPESSQVELTVEYDNGSTFNLNGYIRGLLATQDMRAWRNDPQAFNAWMRRTVSDIVSRVNYTIS